MRWVTSIVLVACATAASCDRRPEGVLVDRAQPRATVTTSDRAPATLPSDDGAKAPARCMVPSPDEPPPPASPAASCPADPVFGGVTLKKGQVSFPEAQGSPTIDVELARSPRERQRGLMFRTQMPDNAGMLFDFPGHPEVQSFWMRNTCIPLDMLFIHEDGFITGILENVPTLNEASRSIPCPVRYVLEVNAGWTRKNGVRAGQFVKLPTGD